ncbi:MAG: hypothetical protein JNK57_00035 [Planctomycetaceae bacterium]|nr:hypothetical protein [Planctomycetaceae bacterium]
MQLLSSDNRRPPVVNKRSESAAFPPDGQREAMLRLLQWFHERRIQRCSIELFNQAASLVSTDRCSEPATLTCSKPALRDMSAPTNLICAE